MSKQTNELFRRLVNGIRNDVILMILEHFPDRFTQAELESVFGLKPSAISKVKHRRMEN